MEKYNLFSDNPFNSENFVYLKQQGGPKERIAKPKAAPEKTSKAANQVARTRDRLNTLLTQLDGKIAKTSAFVNKYKNMDRSKFNPKFRKYLAFAEKNLRYYTHLKIKINRINDKFQRIEAIRQNKYSKVSMYTLNKINGEIDKVSHYFRRELMRGMAKQIQTIFLKSNYGNVAHFKDYFTMMKDWEVRTYGGLRIAKNKDTLVIRYGGKRLEMKFSVNPKTLEWQVADKDGKPFPEKPTIRRGALEGLKESKRMPKNFYFDPGVTNVAAKQYNLLKETAPKRRTVSDRLETTKRKLSAPKVIGKPRQKETKNRNYAHVVNKVKNMGRNEKLSNEDHRIILKIAQLLKKDSYLAYPKTKTKSQMRAIFTKSADGSYLRVSVGKINAAERLKFSGTISIISLMDGKKIADHNVPSIVFPNDPFNQKIKAAKGPRKTVKRRNTGKETDKSTIKHAEEMQRLKHLNKWSKDVVTNIKDALKNLTMANFTLAKKFLMAAPGRTIAEKQRYMNKYGYRLKKVLEKIQSNKGVNIEAQLNTLAKAYKLIPKKLEGHIAKRFMVKFSKPPIKVAVLDSVMKREWNETPAPKPKTAPKKIVAKKPTVKPKAAPVKLATKEKKEKAPGLKRWTKQTENNLKEIRRSLIIGKSQDLLNKVYGPYANKVMVQLNNLNRQLKMPITFLKAVQLRKKLVKGFSHLRTKATKQKLYSKLDKKTKDKISKMTVLNFPPTPTNPTVAEQKAVNYRNRQVAKMDKFIGPKRKA